MVIVSILSTPLMHHFYSYMGVYPYVYSVTPQLSKSIRDGNDVEDSQISIETHAFEFIKIESLCVG